MRILADTNIVRQAVRALRDIGHDVKYVGERAVDPGDSALLAEAVAEGRVFITKYRDVGTLIRRDGQPHRGVLLLDDLGDAAAERRLILGAFESSAEALAGGALLRATAGGVRGEY